MNYFEYWMFVWEGRFLSWGHNKRYFHLLDKTIEKAKTNEKFVLDALLALAED